MSNSWIKKKLIEVSKVISGGTPKSSNPNYFGGTTVWLTPKDLSKHSDIYISNSERTLTEDGIKNSSARLIPEGSVTLSSRAPIGYVAIPTKPFTTNQGMKSFVPTKDLFNEYLYYYLIYSKSALEKEGSGTTFKEISKSKLEDFQIPIPSFTEQKQIVSKIKEYFNYLDKAEEKFKIANTNFDKVMDSAQVKYIDIEGKQNNWDYKTIGEISKINPTKSEIKDIDPDSQVSFIQMSSVSDKTGTIEKQETRTVKEVKKGYTYFKRGDIIFAKITPCMENGKCSLTDTLNSDIGFGSTEFHVIRVDRKQVLPEYLYTILRSQKFRRLAMTNMTGTAGQKRLPKEYLSSFKIYVPNKEKQIEIVKKLLDLEKERVRYSLVYQSSIKNILLLRQSILKKAFEGKLIRNGVCGHNTIPNGQHDYKPYNSRNNS